MNLLLALLLILGVGFYLSFVAAMFRELMRYRPRGTRGQGFQGGSLVVGNASDKQESWPFFRKNV